MRMKFCCCTGWRQCCISAGRFFYTLAMEPGGRIRFEEFDGSLIRPLQPFVQERFGEVNFGYISHLTLSLAMVLYDYERLVARHAGEKVFCNCASWLQLRKQEQILIIFVDSIEIMKKGRYNWVI